MKEQKLVAVYLGKNIIRIKDQRGFGERFENVNGELHNLKPRDELVILYPTMEVLEINGSPVTTPEPSKEDQKS